MKNIEKFKKQLENEQLEIQTKLSSLTEDTVAIDVDGDETDEVQGELINSVNVAISNRDIIRLAKINAALIKIRDGLFGVCEECGEDIELKRLQFSPEIPTCIVCAEILERKAKSF